MTKHYTIEFLSPISDKNDNWATVGLFYHVADGPEKMVEVADQLIPALKKLYHPVWGDKHITYVIKEQKIDYK